MIRRHAAFFVSLLAVLGTPPGLGATTVPRSVPEAEESVSRPLAPDYTIGADGSVTLRICFNWSCSRKQILTFTADDMARVKEQLALCSGNKLYDRLQRLRIGIWQMETLARKYQPLLANDRGINDSEYGVEGRTDCIDNTTNTTTFLHILNDLQEIPGWSVPPPRVRNRFNSQVHWTAVVIDTNSGNPWSVDSWYRPNGHLPMVMPLRDWTREKLGWEPPLDRLNPTPRFSYEICGTQPRLRLSETGQRWLRAQ